MARFAVGLSSRLSRSILNPVTMRTPSAGVRSRYTRVWFGGSLLLFCLIGAGRAQNGPSLGVLPFSTNQFGVDLATTNVNIAVPLRSKIGKIPFLSQIVGTSGAFPSGGKWYPSLVANADPYAPQGFAYSDTALHYASSTFDRVKKGCSSDGSSYYTYYSMSIVDATGAGHSMYVGGSGWNGPGFQAPGPSACFTSLASPVIAGDGSGYQLVVSNGIGTIYGKDGASYGGCERAGQINTECTLSVISDVDNATISDGFNGLDPLAVVSVTDTLGQTALSTVLGGSGSCPSGSECYTYLDANGGTQQVAVNYTTKNHPRPN
jgi:hypothetical protein